MRLARHVATAFAVVFTATAPLAAQTTALTGGSQDQSASTGVAVEQPAPNTTAAQPVSFAPTEANARVGVRAMKSPAPAPAEPEHEHMRQSEAMMIVGGAILIVGAVVGGRPGTIIMIGGGAIGIVGLIRYLQ